MNSLEFAVIAEFARVRFNNELDEMTTEQSNIIDELCDKAWCTVTEKDLIKFNFNDDAKSFYKSIAEACNEIMKNNNLSFIDDRCNSYLFDSVYDMIKNKF